MGKYFRTVYLYIVAFATLCMMITGFVGTVYSAVGYACPVVDEYAIEDIYYDYDYTYDYDTELKDDEQVNVDYSSRLQNLEKVEQRASLKATFIYLAILICGTPLYILHVKQIKKESKKEV